MSKRPAADLYHDADNLIFVARRHEPDDYVGVIDWDFTDKADKASLGILAYHFDTETFTGSVRSSNEEDTDYLDGEEATVTQLETMRKALPDAELALLDELKASIGKQSSPAL